MFSDFLHFSSARVAAIITVTADTALYDQAFERRDFPAIVKNNDLFWVHSAKPFFRISYWKIKQPFTFQSKKKQ